MMNPFTSVPAGLTILSEMNRFNRKAPQFEALRKEKKFEEERAMILDGTSYFADAVSRKIGIQFDIHGEENIPAHGPVLIVANHQSYADILAMIYTIRKFQIGFIAKSEFTSFKPLAKAIRYTRSLFIQRGDARAAIQTLNDAANLMKEGFPSLFSRRALEAALAKWANSKPAASNSPRKPRFRFSRLR